MQVDCRWHGMSEGVEVSPDLADPARSRRALPPFREVIYRYEGEPYLRMLLSADFVDSYGVTEEGSIDLPDQYPPWYKEMAVVCERCAEEAIGRSRP